MNILFWLPEHHLLYTVRVFVLILHFIDIVKVHVHALHVETNHESYMQVLGTGISSCISNIMSNLEGALQLIKNLCTKTVYIHVEPSIQRHLGFLQEISEFFEPTCLCMFHIRFLFSGGTINRAKIAAAEGFVCFLPWENCKFQATEDALEGGGETRGCPSPLLYKTLHVHVHLDELK